MEDLIRMGVSTVCERGRERVRERGRDTERKRKTEHTEWYYLHNKRSAYFPINRTLHRERERERETERERKRERGRCKMVKTQK